MQTYNVTGVPALDEALAVEHSKFLADSTIAIMTLVNEYKRKKDAWELAVRSHVRSGDIDFDRIMNYKTSDDIFKIMCVGRKGKSHGVVIMLDNSLSMNTPTTGRYRGKDPIDTRLAAAARQAVITAKFCQQCKIPYRIYTMNESVVSRHESGLANEAKSLYGTQIDDAQNAIVFGANHLNLLASSAGSVYEQDKELFCLHMFTQGYHVRWYDINNYTYNVYANLMAVMAQHTLPQHISREIEYTSPHIKEHARVYADTTPSEQHTKLRELIKQYRPCGGTPLISAIYALSYVTRDFKQEKQLQNVSVFILGDGQATGTPQVMNKNIQGAGYSGASYRASSQMSYMVDNTEAKASVLYDYNTGKAINLSSLMSADADMIGSPYATALSCAVGFLKQTTQCKVGFISLDNNIGMAFKNFASRSVSALATRESRDLVAAHMAEHGKNYTKFLGLLNYDVVVMVADDAFKGKDTSGLDVKRNAKGNVVASELNKFFSASLDNVRFEKMMAKDIADMITSEFSLKPPLRPWYTRFDKIDCCDPAILESISKETDGYNYSDINDLDDDELTD